MSGIRLAEPISACELKGSLKLTIEYLSIERLVPNNRNARRHSKKQLAKLEQSIRKNGFVNAILVDETFVIIAGHARWSAAKAAGLTEVPIVMLRHLNEQQKLALSLADNRIQQEGVWDEGLLKGTLKELSLVEGFDMSLTGFELPEIDIRISEKLNGGEDHIPACPKTPRAKTGDIIVLGPHRITCGDARDAGLMRRMMGGVLAKTAFLDVPFNVPIAGHANTKVRSGDTGRVQHAEFLMLKGELSPEQHVEFLGSACRLAAELSEDGAVHFICMDWRHMLELRRAADPVYGQLLNVCIWNKSNSGMGSLYRSKHEDIYIYRVGSAQHYNAIELGKHGRNRSNVWEYPSVNTFGGARDEDRKLHPTIKPVALVADAIRDVTKRGDVVLDTFFGSGTSLIACEQTGRVFRGADLDPHYVDIAVERWVAMTGGKPMLSVADGWGVKEIPYER